MPRSPSGPTRRSRTRCALIVRERLTGSLPPETAKAMVDLWRPWIEERAGRTLARLDKVAENQETFGRAAARPAQGARPVRRAVRRRARGRRGRRAGPRERRAERRGAARKARTARTRPATTSAARARRARPPRPPRTPTPTSSTPTPTARRWPTRASPGGPTTTCSITRRPSATRFSAAPTTRRSPPRTSPRPTSWSGCAPSSTRSCATYRARWRGSPTGCSAS